MMETCPYHSGLDERIKSLCHKIDEREKQFNLIIDAQREAFKTAKAELERRLEEMNNFRAQLGSQANTFITIKEVEQRMCHTEDQSLSRWRGMGETLKLTIGPLEDRIREIEKKSVREEGASVWKTSIITALISISLFMMAHWILKF